MTAYLSNNTARHGAGVVGRSRWIYGGLYRGRIFTETGIWRLRWWRCAHEASVMVTAVADGARAVHMARNISRETDMEVD